MARPNNLSLATCHLCFILLYAVGLASVADASDSALCHIPSPGPTLVSAGKDALALLELFQLSAGYFVGGEEIHFAKEETDEWSYVSRSLSLLPHSVDHTDDPGLLHVGATLTLSGGRTRQLQGGGRRRRNYLGGHSVSFSLDGYYTRFTGELCMAGSGTYLDDDGSLERLSGVVLKLRVPGAPSLKDPFVTGRLKGDGFEDISLVAYAEGDSYKYGEQAATCPPSRPSSSPVRGAFHALGANFSCARLKDHLMSSFKLQYGGGGKPALGSMQLQEPRMQIGQVQCSTDGAVRAYVTFANNTKARRGLGALGPRFTVKEEAVVAEGRWNSDTNMLCLRACRVVRSKPTFPAVRPQECGIGMSFWFPGVWTIHDRSAVLGMLWNSSQAAGSKDGSGVISVSSTDSKTHRGDFSDVRYSYDYTMVEEAKKHYLTSELSNHHNNKVKGSFMAPNYTYHDFEFRFWSDPGNGDAYPVTIGPAMVYGDRLAADDSFSRHVVVDVKHDLLNVSYDIRHYVPPEGWVRPKNNTYSVQLEERRITAEGIYDPKTGVLCMIGCQEINASTDCQMLITLQFASLDAETQGHGNGVISSLREKTDPLFFNKTEIRLFGMYTEQVAESISRMDMESVMLVVSTTLPCVVTALQILHAKRNPEASAATSITMLFVLALGYVFPLLVRSETLFMSRRSQWQWVPFQSYVPYELNQAMMRAPTLISLVMQLRLIQLAMSSRNSATDQSKAEASSAAEKRALWVCLPLYLVGGALTIIVNVVNRRRAQDSLTVTVGPAPATLWEDIVSSAGLALDGFLLPQVAMNAFSAGVVVVRAISPWFYIGGTVVRAMPHVYDVIRRQKYAPSMQPSYVYAGPRDDRFGLAWDVAVPCVTVSLATLLFLQQRRAGAFLPRSRKPGGYEMVSSSSI